MMYRRVISVAILLFCHVVAETATGSQQEQPPPPEEEEDDGFDFMADEEDGQQQRMNMEDMPFPILLGAVCGGVFVATRVRKLNSPVRKEVLQEGLAASATNKVILVESEDEIEQDKDRCYKQWYGLSGTTRVRRSGKVHYVPKAIYSD